MTFFFRFVNKRANYRLGIISLAHAPVHVTYFPVVNIHADELSSARLIKFTNICQPMLKHILASMNYFDSDMSKSTNTVVYFDGKTVIYIYICGQCRTQFMLPNSIGYNLISTCASACDLLSCRKYTC
jgi:ligand-binding sensor protein